MVIVNMEKGMKRSLVGELVELLCIGKLLMKGKFTPDKRLAFIFLDIAVEHALKSYATHHNLIKVGKSNEKAISLILNKLKDQNKIVSYEKRTILKYHKMASELYNKQKMSGLNEKTVEDYLILARILLARLYDFRASKAEWQKLVNKTAKSLYSYSGRS